MVVYRGRKEQRNGVAIGYFFSKLEASTIGSFPIVIGGVDEKESSWPS